MLRKPLDALEWNDIVDLATNGIPETTSLEFKAQPIADTLEIARDVCAMANGGGGDLVLGVPEVNGIAQPPTPFPNGEREGNRVVQVVVAGVSPPMPGMHTKHVTNPVGGGDVVVIRIPRATVPAMVHLQNRSEFWVRRDRQRVLMTHGEIIERVRIGLRDEKDVDEFIAKRIDEFSRQRVKGLSIFLAVTPTSPAGVVKVPMRDSRVHSILKDSRNDKTSLVWGVSPHPSLDGLEGRVGEDYVFELHHRGHVEIIHYSAGEIIRSRVHVPQGNPALEGYFLATTIVAVVRRARQVYEASGSFEPYVVTLQMNNTQNTMMPRGEGDFGTVYRRAVLKVHVVGYYDDENDLPAKRVCDRLWQAYGYAECPFFDANHNFMPRA